MCTTNYYRRDSELNNYRNINKYPLNQFAGKVLLLNAPPGAGKDYAAMRISYALGCEGRSFKAPMFEIAKAITGLTHEEFFNIYDDRDKKELPQLEFHGLSPREFMIWISEDVIKPKFGNDFFGAASANACNPDTGAVFSDSGFASEVFPLACRFGAENIYVCQFTRNGKVFGKSDSREYLKANELPEGVNFLPFMENDGCIQAFTNKITDYVMTY